MFFLVYFVWMIRSFFIPVLVNLLLCLNLSAQTDHVPYAPHTTKENRVKEYRNLVNHSINKNLSLDLTDSTEENWEDAFWAMELINYKSPWTDSRIRLAFDSIEKRSIGFQRAALELIYTLQIKEYTAAVHKLLLQTNNSKIFAMSAEYLLLCNSSLTVISEISDIADKKIANFKGDNNLAIFYSLLIRIEKKLSSVSINTDLAPLFATDYLKGNVIVYSIQRKNRNYQGITIVKDRNGNFITDQPGNIFSVPQLARSITNLPGYLTNGNTPQGIFRMDGFDISRSSFIGPTENIQLTMPVETSIQHFFSDSSLTDTIWTPAVYEKLLPNGLKNYRSLFESFYSGMAGRTEIIAHGTTVNPEYYANQPYYPLTPTQGCLATKEIWSTVDGKRMETDQQKLVNAIKAAGGADGYCIVIEIDDQQKPVSTQDILPYLNQKIK
jgi:hypothetical protein